MLPGTVALNFHCLVTGSCRTYRFAVLQSLRVSPSPGQQACELAWYLILRTTDYERKLIDNKLSVLIPDDYTFPRERKGVADAKPLFDIKDAIALLDGSQRLRSRSPSKRGE